MLLSRNISCKILQLKLFSSILSNFKGKITITGTPTSTRSSKLIVFALNEIKILTIAFNLA